MSTNRLSSFFCFNDVIRKELQSLIVYKLSCNNWDITLFQKTEHHFNVKSVEHLGISNFEGKNLECKQSRVSDLLHKNDIDFTDKILMVTNLY